MNWEELKNKKPLEAKTPAEYLECARRIIEVLMLHWDEFEDGDGETPSEDGQPLTKTDMFNMIAGSCDSARESISNFNKLLNTKGG